MKYVLVLLAFAGRAALADTASCDARTASELRTVFVVAISLNDAFLHTKSGTNTPEYADLRAKLADYDARQSLPCVAVAVELLESRADLPLGRALLELVSSRARSAYSDAGTVPRSLAHFLATRPDDFLNALARMPAADRCALVETVESGWPGVNLTPRAAMTGEPAHGGELIANLKRAHCQAPSPKPRVEAPSTRARGQSAGERRQSRPRFARAAPASTNALASAFLSERSRAGSSTSNHPGLARPIDHQEPA